MVLHGQILASQVQNVWRVDVIMQVDTLKQKAKPSEVVVTPVQTPQPVSGATPVIMAPPPVSLVTCTPSPCMPSTRSTCSSRLAEAYPFFSSYNSSVLTGPPL